LRSSFTLILAAAVVLVVALFMLTFTVRFTEVGVVTTFGKADEGSIVSSAGLKMRWPYPIQNVTLYDTRSRFVRLSSEQQQTSDSRQIVVESFLLWKVSDPLKFYQRFSGESAEAREHYDSADQLLRSLLRASMSEIGRYRLDQLFSSQINSSKLPELEDAILHRLSNSGGANSGGTNLSDYGIDVSLVGLTRVEFPEETNKDVFERMKSTRERIASEAESEGAAQALKIQKDAETSAALIMAFAEQRAAQIRSQGDAEAAQYLKLLAEDPALAVFIENIKFMKNLISKRTTLVLPTTMEGMSLFDPASLRTMGGDGLTPGRSTQADDR
jgi:membrane protease subunit HflC